VLCASEKSARSLRRVNLDDVRARCSEEVETLRTSALAVQLRLRRISGLSSYRNRALQLKRSPDGLAVRMRDLGSNARARRERALSAPHSPPSSARRYDVSRALRLRGHTHTQPRMGTRTGGIACHGGTARLGSARLGSAASPSRARARGTRDGACAGQYAGRWCRSRARLGQ